MARGTPQRDVGGSFASRSTVARFRRATQSFRDKARGVRSCGRNGLFKRFSGAVIDDADEYAEAQRCTAHQIIKVSRVNNIRAPMFQGSKVPGVPRAWFGSRELTLNLCNL